jgi:hypothetical protein
MELDELKSAWKTHGTLLERSLAIDERLLREVVARKVRFALAPFVLWRVLEIALGVAALTAIVPLLAAHLHETRYLLVAGSLGVYLAVVALYSMTQLVHALRIDLTGPVTTIQGDVERLKLLEYRSFRWALLCGIIVWLPALMVPFEIVTGVEVIARCDFGWLAANVLVGIALLALGFWWSKRDVDRAISSPFALRVVDALSGSGLRRANRHLEDLAHFVREP